MAVLFLLLSQLSYAVDEPVYSDDKPNIAIEARHPEFTVKLKSNPTTGYAWYLREYNHYLITPVKHSYQSSNAKLIGGSGYELWTFRVKPVAFAVPHQLTIRFIYARPWQSTDSASQAIFRVTTTAHH